MRSPGGDGGGKIQEGQPLPTVKKWLSCCGTKYKDADTKKVLEAGTSPTVKGPFQGLQFPCPVRPAEFRSLQRIAVRSAPSSSDQPYPLASVLASLVCCPFSIPPLG